MGILLWDMFFCLFFFFWGILRLINIYFFFILLIVKCGIGNILYYECIRFIISDVMGFTSNYCMI